MEKVQYCHTADLTDGGGSLKIILLPYSNHILLLFNFLAQYDSPALSISICVCMCASPTDRNVMYKCNRHFHFRGML